MKALQPQSVEQTCVNYSKPGAKGDGIKACLWAGAIMDTTHASMIFDRGAIKPIRWASTARPAMACCSGWAASRS